MIACSIIQKSQFEGVLRLDRRYRLLSNQTPRRQPVLQTNPARQGFAT